MTQAVRIVNHVRVVSTYQAPSRQSPVAAFEAITRFHTAIGSYTSVGPLLLDFPDSPRCRKIFPPLSLFVHRCSDLEFAVEIVLGRIDGDAPADFAVEVEPQETLVFGRNADHAVGYPVG